MSTDQSTPTPVPAPVRPAQPIYVQVISDYIDELRGIAKHTGKPYHLRRQAAYIMNDGLQAYPTKFILMLRETEGAYQPGWYCVLPQSFDVDENKDLMVRVRLQPCPDPRQTKAA